MRMCTNQPPCTGRTENNRQTFPLPLCQGIRGFSVTKQKALSKAGVFALMKRSAASLSEEEALTIFDLPDTDAAARR